MAKLPKKLVQKLEKRRLEDALRILPGQQSLIDFTSNDYLGLAQQDLADAVTELLEENKLNPNGSSGSRLLTGNHILFKELEDFLANYHNSEAALIFNSGYDVNIGVFSSVPQRGDVIFYDELVHASIRDGVQMSNAKSYKFGHNDVDNLRYHIERNRNMDSDIEIYVVTESVFSMDGDSPDLELLANFCVENDCHLIVDEAHATGIFGDRKDLICEMGLEKKVFARIITFGKAIGNHGAAVLCSEELKTYLINFARSLIYTTALSPHSVASILVTYRYLREQGKEEHVKLLNNIQYFKEQVRSFDLDGNFIDSDSAIHCLVVSGNKSVKKLSRQLKEEGFDVKPILSPTVKKGEERLRFCLHSYNSKEEIKNLLQTLKNYNG